MVVFLILAPTGQAALAAEATEEKPLYCLRLEPQIWAVVVAAVVLRRVPLM